MNTDDLVGQLISAGVAETSIVRLDQQATPRHLRYLDLLKECPKVDAMGPDVVVESGGQPQVYVVRQDRLGGSQGRSRQALFELIRVLGCRSDARFLVVVQHGGLDVYPVGVFTSVPQPLITDREEPAALWRSLLGGVEFSRQTSPGLKANYHWIENLLFKLLVAAATDIKAACSDLTARQVLSLVGRSLFFRFLVDRNIVKETDLPSISQKAESLSELFSTPQAMEDTCLWLDKTFNGDLLSLEDNGYQRIFRHIDDNIEKVCWSLSNIQHHAANGQLQLDWGWIKFQHVPVDVLSQVYEDFAHQFVPDLARKTSVHFTPRQIAEVVIEGAFSAVKSALPHEARVLDPSAGAGVFLVLALRRLVAEHWLHTGVRPTRQVIRQVLANQLSGFDINLDALNIAALSLYLAALELDPKPSPLTDLKFKKLIGSVLRLVDNESLGTKTDLGSLSQPIIQGIENHYDIVVGNPPWTGFKGGAAKSLNETLAQLIRHEADTTVAKSEADGVVARYGSPDIAFLLAARLWTKPEGAIALALHGRFLFQKDAYALRRHVFSVLRVTGIMNFAALRQDKRLWPTNDAQFILLVAENSQPKQSDRFYFISPRQEPQLAAVGQFRVDPSAAIPVSCQVPCKHLDAFKALYKGGPLGFELISRIQHENRHSVKTQLDQLNLKFKSGYQLGKVENRIRSAQHLVGCPTADLNMCYRVDERFAETFDIETLQWPRTPDIYEGPLLLFRESPKLDRAVRGALVSETKTAFSESFFGLSFRGKVQYRSLMDLLYILSYSDLLIYYQLLTSAKFGVERDSSLQCDLENFPLVDWESLDREMNHRVRKVASKLSAGDPCWKEVDEIVADIYELSHADQQLIKDTLSVELPFVGARHFANQSVSETDLIAFTDAFNRIAGPFSNSEHAVAMPLGKHRGWSFIQIGGNQNREDLFTMFKELERLCVTGDSYWASQLRYHVADGIEILGRIDQMRYWTKTEARIQALEWLRQCAEVAEQEV
ncbi:Type I restriction-modification system methyltransferase subunit [Hahella chejuensis KCTC 2396]|uniref:site-specific DNA-methyltransferase (adenine-specific) n=1 Tax=Hahella chejuensis (strain KCTC 2396) TaxID=349521 RepID=Q2S6S3_HAHCH|nr:N-6 DNA methylase [Hahella chejuensis]ABC33651.1 Type I restriction-modification system methyltransferase subunit [Hahella chejuensis KCTC 2396]